jgi:DNA-directed RNA polymerase specialized sigma subunit
VSLIIENEAELFEEIEQVLGDYPMMRIHLRFLASAEESYDFSNEKPRVSGGDSTSRVERLAVKRADYGRYVAMIDAVMAAMPGIQREFVQLRYFTGMQMEDVAEMIHCGERTVYDVRTKVLDRFAVALGWGRRHERFLKPVRVQGVLFSVV